MKNVSPISLPLLLEFEKFIRDCKKGKRTKYAGRKLAVGTITQYQCVYKLLQEFEGKQPPPLRILLLKRQSVAVIKKEKRYWNQFFFGFTAFLYQQKKCYDSYVGSVCKVLKTFFLYLSDERGLPIGNFHKGFNIPQHLFTPLILEPSKLQRLIQDDAFESALPSHLKRTKDLFVFGCTIALRYSDLMGLRKAHLIHSPEGKYLQIHTRKTGTMVKLPLPGYLLAILEKYKRLPGKQLLPRLSSTNMNLQVKALCKLAGWDYHLPKVRYRMGKPVEVKGPASESLRYHEQVTTHTMRRTAITTLLLMGVPELVVRRISGHSAHSKEFYRYVVMAQDYLNRQVLQAYDKLLRFAG